MPLWACFSTIDVTTSSPGKREGEERRSSWGLEYAHSTVILMAPALPAAP